MTSAGYEATRKSICRIIDRKSDKAYSDIAFSKLPLKTEVFRGSLMYQLQLQEQFMGENNSENKFSLKSGFSAASKEATAFKKFISRGNVVDMAVGVIIGGAFGKIISSLVNDIIMPLIGLLIGGIDFTNLSVKIGEATVAYGKFIQTVVDFLIVAICIFIVVRIFERFKKKEEEIEAPPAKPADVVLLEEIRDILKNKN